MSLGAAMTAAVKELTDAIESAGVPASTVVAEVRVPGAWVSPRTMTVETLSGGGTLRCHVYLIAGDVTADQALKELGGLLDKALTVVDPDEPVDMAQAVALPDTPPMPAYRLTIDQHVNP